MAGPGAMICRGGTGRRQTIAANGIVDIASNAARLSCTAEARAAATNIRPARATNLWTTDRLGDRFG
jgi:hypothetical protein